MTYGKPWHLDLLDRVPVFGGGGSFQAVDDTASMNRGGPILGAYSKQSHLIFRFSLSTAPFNWLLRKLSNDLFLDRK